MNIRKLMISLFSGITIYSLSAAGAWAGDFAKYESRSSPARSRISVQAEDLTPGALFTATVSSGGNSAMATIAADPGGKADYDFDSNINDVIGGATAIAADFIDGEVVASVTDALGNEVASETVSCETK